MASKLNICNIHREAGTQARPVGIPGTEEGELVRREILDLLQGDQEDTYCHIPVQEDLRRRVVALDKDTMKEARNLANNLAEMEAHSLANNPLEMEARTGMKARTGTKAERQGEDHREKSSY